MSRDSCIGVLTYRRADMLAACCAAIRRHTDGLGDCAFVVASTSSSAEYNAQAAAIAAGAGAEFHAFGRNEGFARGMNWLARRHAAEKVMLFNDDVKVFRGWKWAIDRTLEDPRVGAVSLCQAGTPDGWNHQEEWNPRVDDIGGLAIVRHPCVFPYGSLIALRRAVFDEAGGLDEQLFQALEEVDLGIRLARRGYINCNIGVSGEAYKFAAHWSGASGGCSPIDGDIPDAFKPLRARNHEYFRQKHGFDYPFPQGIEDELTRHMRQ